jgi:hypothetical protein
MKNNNKDDEVRDFPSEKLIQDVNRVLKWNGSTDILWNNIEARLDENRKSWRLKFRIHLVLACILIFALILIMIASKM